MYIAYIPQIGKETLKHVNMEPVGLGSVGISIACSQKSPRTVYPTGIEIVIPIKFWYVVCMTRSKHWVVCMSHCLGKYLLFTTLMERWVYFIWAYLSSSNIKGMKQLSVYHGGNLFFWLIWWRSWLWRPRIGGLGKHLNWVGNKPKGGRVLMLDGWGVRLYAIILSPILTG